MSVFNDIAVLKRPAPEMKDWSFMLGELKFEVHDAEVELTSQLKSFEQFAGAMDKLDMLLDHIDQNDGKLEKAVFDLVNQNNELAMALGIIMPYSFATEEEQAQAAQDVKEAAGADNAEGEEDKGFFAKAWEGIKKFFRSIKEACVKAWNAIRGKNKTEDEQNNAANQVLESMEPKEVQAALDNAFSKAGRVYITLADAERMTGDIEKIAQHCSSIGSNFGNAVEFFKFLDQFDGSFAAAFEPVKDTLGHLGITLVDNNVNGQKVTDVKKSAKTVYDITPEKLKSARDAFIDNSGERAVSYVQAFMGKNGSVRLRVKSAIKNLDELINNVNDLLSKMEEPATIEEITKLVEGGAIKQWFRKMAGAQKAQQKINIAKVIGRNISKVLSVVMEVVKLADNKIISTSNAIDAQILLRNKRADNKEVQDLKDRRQKDANIEAQHQANANADENAAQRGEDPYGDSIG